MADNIDFKVCCTCFTFNQSQYITDAMNGFCMQETDFPFVCCIVDDASADGEQEVINKYVEENFNVTDTSVAYKKETGYAHITFAQHKENKNCYFAVLLLKENHYGKKSKTPYLSEWRDICEYEAMCEGDDYWIDPQKLQKQVSFMDSNQSCVLCHSAFKSYYQSISEYIDCTVDSSNILEIVESGENVALNILDDTRYRIQPVTALYRLSMYPYVRERLNKMMGKFLMGDTQTWIYFLDCGSIHYMPEVTSVYRVNNGSACNQLSAKKKIRFDLSIAEMRVFMANEINAPMDYKIRFQKQYQKKLNLYYCYDPEYKPFIEIIFSSKRDKLQYYILKLPIVRRILKSSYERKYNIN